jgi:GntR family transcriptional regulator
VKGAIVLLNLTDLSDEPLQSQIARQIRAKILAGDLAAGHSLPSIRALARDARVSVITVQRGYEDLERDGLIHSRRGKGFFVSELRDARRKQMAQERLAAQMEPIVRDALSEGLTASEVAATVKTTISRQAGGHDQNR